MNDAEWEKPVASGYSRKQRRALLDSDLRGWGGRGDCCWCGRMKHFDLCKFTGRERVTIAGEWSSISDICLIGALSASCGAGCFQTFYDGRTGERMDGWSGIFSARQQRDKQTNNRKSNVPEKDGPQRHRRRRWGTKLTECFFECVYALSLCIWTCAVGADPDDSNRWYTDSVRTAAVTRRRTLSHSFGQRIRMKILPKKNGLIICKWRFFWRSNMKLMICLDSERSGQRLEMRRIFNLISIMII